MAQLFAKDPRTAGLFIGGSRLSGAEIRDQNVLAAQTIANIVKTSLGPVGLDKCVFFTLSTFTPQMGRNEDAAV